MWPGVDTGASWFETALTRLLTMRIESVLESEDSKCANQCSDVYAAPSIGPGFSRLPSWT